MSSLRVRMMTKPPCRQPSRGRSRKLSLRACSAPTHGEPPGATVTSPCIASALANLRCTHCLEQSLEHRHVEAFVLERKTQMARQGSRRRVPRRQKLPGLITISAVTLPNRFQLSRPRDV
jgi:hypothetical protein